MKQITGMMTAVAALTALTTSAFTLVENGQARPVVLPANAEESTKLAAREFTNYVAKATGVALEVEGEGRGGERTGKVFIGTLKTLRDVPEAIKAKLAESKSSEASVTAEIDGNFWIVGKEEVAELYGVYKTLEDQFGIRWFKAWEPDDPGDFVPEVGSKSEEGRSVELDGKFWFRAPYFQKRRLDMTGSSCAYIPYKGVEWVYRAGLQAWPQGGGGLGLVKLLTGPRPGPKDRHRGFWDYYKPRTQIRLLSIGGGHCMLFEPIPAKDYFDAHPEYFAEVDGQRRKGDRYCLSNPEVQHLVAQHIIKVLKLTNGQGEYLFGLQDGRSNICECKECRALDDAGAKDRQLNSDISTRFNKVVKNIAAEVYREFPDTDALTDWVYSIYGRTPPEGMKHDPRMGAQFCVTGRCYGHCLDDASCSINRERYAWLQGWMKVLSHGYTYEYGNCSANSYMPYELGCASDLKLYKRMGLTGWKEEMTFTDSTPPSRFPKDPEMIRRRSEDAPSCWQWFYVASRLTWNPDLDPQVVLDEIESKYYGPAYPVMKKYHALRRKLWAESKVCMGWPRGNGRGPTLLEVPGAKEELLRLLDEAEQLVHSSTSTSNFNSAVLKHRIAKDRRWLTIFWIEPNDKLQEKKARALTLTRTETAPVIDGDGSDAAWTDACRTTDFFEVWNSQTLVPPKPELATSFSVTADDANLYVLLQAKEPTPDKMVLRRKAGEGVYEDDSFEVMFFPPSEANTFFQLCVNAKGEVTCYEQPVGRRRTDLGETVVTKIGTDAYTVEIKLPVAKIYPLEKGESWRFFVARNRMIKDERTPNQRSWSIDAGKVNNPTDWRALHIWEKK